MKIVIATCDKYKDKTVPVLLKSLLEARVSDTDIIISCNSVKNELLYFDGIKCYAHNCELYENVSFRTCLLIKEDIILLHDTCKVLPTFKEHISSFDYSPFDSVMLTSAHTSCSMGYYSYNYIESKKEQIISWHNLVKHEAVQLENKMFGGKVGSFSSKPARISSPKESIYNTSTQRMTEIYDPPGVVKYKANWGANNGSGYFKDV